MELVYRMLLALAWCCLVLLPVSRGQVAKSNAECTYFGGGRQPREAYSLPNCTWYRENACCERTEVTSVFSEMPALLTSNKDCYNRMNYLMCYFCSPEQHLWFNKSVAVCRSYCQDLYQACRSAKYNGVSIGSQYKTGEEFCNAQAFNVVDKIARKCFDFDPTHFDTCSLEKASKWLSMLTLVATLWIYHEAD